jgi:hypothetical protein
MTSKAFVILHKLYLSILNVTLFSTALNCDGTLQVSNNKSYIQDNIIFTKVNFYFRTAIGVTLNEIIT